MNSQLKNGLLVFFIFGAVWDAATTWGGLRQILENDLLSFILMIFINSLLALTYIKFDMEGSIKTIAHLMWVAALCGDLITAFKGNWRILQIEEPTFLQFILLSIATIFTCGSTIFVSFLVFRVPITKN